MIMIKKIIAPLYNLFNVYNSLPVEGGYFLQRIFFGLFFAPPIIYFIYQITELDGREGVIEFIFVILYAIVTMILINLINKYGNEHNVKKENNIDKVVFPSIIRIIVYWSLIFGLYKLTLGILL